MSQPYTSHWIPARAGLNAPDAAGHGVPSALERLADDIAERRTSLSDLVADVTGGGLDIREAAWAWVRAHPAPRGWPFGNALPDKPQLAQPLIAERNERDDRAAARSRASAARAKLRRDKRRALELVRAGDSIATLADRMECSAKRLERWRKSDAGWCDAIDERREYKGGKRWDASASAGGRSRAALLEHARPGMSVAEVAAAAGLTGQGARYHMRRYPEWRARFEAVLRGDARAEG